MHLSLVGKYSHKKYYASAISIPERKLYCHKASSFPKLAGTSHIHKQALVKAEKVV